LDETTEIIFQTDIALPHIFITVAGKGEKGFNAFLRSIRKKSDRLGFRLRTGKNNLKRNNRKKT